MVREKLISYIQLINTNGIGPIGFKKLIARYGDVDEVLKEISQKKVLFSRKKAEEEVMTAEIKGVQIISYEDQNYPYNLKQIEDFPPILYAKGNVDLLKNDNMLAIVGSRNASLSAMKLAENLASNIADNNITIVSGMARGIDKAAHKGALGHNGCTIAVMGTGIDVVYPQENEDLYKDIIKKDGLILTEYAFHTRPQASNFPRRNRIVSGLSKGVLVIEAGLRSGSLITAHQALEQGRDVYAVPGAPYDARSAGCNKLLKEGAQLVDTPEDILESFNFSPRQFILKAKEKEEMSDLFEYSLDNQENNSDIPEQKEELEQEDKYTKLLSLISASGEDIDELIRAMQLPTEEVLMTIVELELDNKIIRLPGNKVAKI